MEYLLLLIMTYLGAQASVFLKRASSGVDSLHKVFLSPNLYLGGCLYLAAALLNIYVLRLLEYSRVLPLTSFTYVWTLMLSFFFFQERIGLGKIIGVALIVLGSLLVAYK